MFDPELKSSDVLAVSETFRFLTLFERKDFQMKIDRGGFN
jgi:hypothetical protein